MNVALTDQREVVGYAAPSEAATCTSARRFGQLIAPTGGSRRPGQAPAPSDGNEAIRMRRGMLR